MGQFLGYIKPDLTLGFRPSQSDVVNAVANISGGALDGKLALGRTYRFAVLVGDEAKFWHENLTDAVISPEVNTSDWTRADSQSARLLVSSDKGDWVEVKGIYTDLGLSKDVRPQKDAILKSFFEKDKAIQKSVITQGQPQEFLDELSTVLDEENLVSEVVTWNTPNELRKYLTKVENPVDVFSDVSFVESEVAQGISSANKKEILPYQYLENGDMVLNPNGAVLLKPYLERLGFKGLASNVSEKERLDIATAVLARILHGKSVYENYSVDEAPLLYRVAVNGIQKGIYPKLEHDNKYDLSVKIPHGYLVDALASLVVDKTMVSVNVLVLILSFIVEHKLFNALEDGFPYLNSEISRKWVAELFEFGG